MHVTHDERDLRLRVDLLSVPWRPIMHSCRESTCGTCETVVLEGVVDHRDSVLTPEECASNDVMFVCVSRAAGPRLVLDL
jgi:ferredoxin